MLPTGGHGFESSLVSLAAFGFAFDGLDLGGTPTAQATHPLPVVRRNPRPRRSPRDGRRRTAAATIDWQFTAEDARIKLKRLYPVIHA